MTAYSKIFVLLIGICGCVLFCLLVVSLPFSPLSPSKESLLKISSIIPEGWGFFTRNPKEEAVLLYKKQGKGWELLTKSNASPSHYFGLSRTGRRFSAETGLVLSSLDDSLWTKKPGEQLDFKVSKITLVRNAFYKPTLHGEYVIIKQERIPWAWSRDHERLIMPYKLIRLFIR